MGQDGRPRVKSCMAGDVRRGGSLRGYCADVAQQTILEYYDLRFGAAPHYNDFRLEVILDGAGGVKHTRLNHRF